MTWQVPDSTRKIGESTRVRYDNPPPWEGGRNCFGAIRPRVLALGEMIQHGFPQVANVLGYSCRSNTAQTVTTSTHGDGRAVDLTIPVTSRGVADNAAGDPVANWAVEHAAEYHIQYVIWDHVRWSGYDGTFAPYHGPNPHVDHVHVEVNYDGAGDGTLPPVPSIPLAQRARKPTSSDTGTGLLIAAGLILAVLYGQG